MLYIDGLEFPVESAELVAEEMPQDRRVTFSLFVDAKDDSGISLNNLSAPGDRNGVPGLTFRLSEDAADENNDLSGSAASFKGATLQVRSIFLRLGSPKEDKIPVDLTATCYELDDAGEQVGKDKNVRVAVEADLTFRSL